MSYLLALNKFQQYTLEKLAKTDVAYTITFDPNEITLLDELVEAELLQDVTDAVKRQNTIPLPWKAYAATATALRLFMDLAEERVH